MCRLGMYRTPKFAEKLGSQDQDLCFVPVVMTVLCLRVGALDPVRRWFV